MDLYEKMKSPIKHIRSGSLTFLLVVLLSTSAVAGATAESSSTADFYDGPPKEGWYWYHDPIVIPPEKPKQQDEQQQDMQSAEQRGPETEKYTYQELYEMYPEEFQKLLKVRLNNAVQAPTEENVGAYLTMQDIARRKSAAFAAAVQFVTQKESATLSVNDVYPENTPGIEARVQMQEKEIEDTINEAKSDHAILFFWKPGCGFCEKQVGILHFFTEKYGWQIKPINIAEQTVLATRFNITTTPTLLLIQQGNEKSMPLAVGVISLAEMEQKLFRAIRYLNGDTDIDTFGSMDYEKGGPLDPKAILQKKQGETSL